MVKNIKRPAWGSFPATVGEMTPKQLFNLMRTAIQYEAQEESVEEAQGWRGSSYLMLAGMFSPEEAQDAPNRHTVYVQQINTAFTGAEGAEDNDEKVEPAPVGSGPKE